MPIEVLVAVFIVVALVAIAVRFVPRDDRGRARLPAIVDQSVGMWAVRQVVGRAGEREEVPESFEVQPTFEEIAYRIGTAGATKPLVRMVPPPAAARRLQSAASTADPIRRIRSRPGRRAGLGLQRRVAAVFAAMLAIGVAAVVATSQPTPDGAVLGATGTPATGSHVEPGRSNEPTEVPDDPDPELP
jgi:hypothetical protein